VPEERLQLFEFQRRGNTKHALFTIKAAVGYEDVAVRIESKAITKCLHGDDSTGDGIIFMNRILNEDLQGFPGAEAEIGKKLAVIQKVTAEHLRDAENKMPMRYLFEDFHTKPLPEFHHALLMTGRAKVAALT
jgi:hypothetical protein